MTTPLKSFGRCETGTSIVETPGSIKEVRKLFAGVNAKHKVTIRGGGHSFDGQALHEGDNGSQIVISTEKFTTIKFLEGGRVELGAGAKWKDILRESLERKLIPAVMQTGGAATAGGTLGGDCLSRFSCSLGKESEWIESFQLVTPAGDCLPCSRDENPDKFFAAIGGHGYIGFVTDIVYQFVPILGGSLAHTNITTYETLESLVEDLIPRAKAAKERAAEYLVAAAPGRSVRPPGRQPAEPPGITRKITALSSLVFESFDDVLKGAIFSSFYTPLSTVKRPHFPLYHDLCSEIRYRSELAARDDFLMRAIHEALFFLMKYGPHQFHDNLDEFTFFMDGNTFAKERFEREHPKKVFPVIQQTYVIPEERTVRFTNDLQKSLKKHKLTPTELDILYVLKDECLLSATYDHDGFAVTVAFENYGTACPPDAVDAFLREMSVTCAKYDGRIHLVKNLRADPHVVQHMLRTSIDQFRSVKNDVDPGGILWNPFFAKIFG